MTRFDAIVLAGGRARRLAGADKPAEFVGGRRLIDIALDAVAGAHRIVVVGPERELPAHVLTTREDPPYSGPVAAVAAGLAALGDRTPADADRPIAVLASDLPEVSPGLINALLAELERTGAPTVLAADESGAVQYLLGVWRPAALAPVLTGRPDAPVRRLIPEGARELPLPDTADIDTPDELAGARRSLREPPTVRALLRRSLPALEPERRPLAECAGTVLAEPLVATRAFPPFDASAMDGYAVAGPPPWTLLDAPRAAGHIDAVELQPGQAIAIATGAALPDGADRAIRHEEITVTGEVLRPSATDETTSPRDDTRRAGSAWAVGAGLAPAGLPVDTALVSVATAAGVDSLAVRGPVRARLYTSGDEIAVGASPGDALPPGTVPDTASAPVTGLLSRAGVQVATGGHLADRPDAFRAALTAPDTELAVVIGATGHGVADHLRSALAAEGAQLLADGLNLRPGGSLIVARMPSGTTLLGLGGNPLAAMAGTALLLPAILDALLARTPQLPETIVLADDGARRPGRWRVLPATPDGTGRWTVTTGGTGHLASMIGSCGLALVPPSESVEPVELLR